MGCDILEYGELARFHRDYYARNQPVILRGLADANRHLKVFHWSARYFQRVLGNTSVEVMKTQSGFLSYERDTEQMPFDKFYAHAFGSHRRDDIRYYYKNSIKQLPSGHDDSSRLPEIGHYLKHAPVKNLWLSGSGLTVGLHFDPAENLNFQLRGRKRFTLYPAGIRGYYPLPMFSQTAHISGVFRDGPQPDLTKFPAFDPRKAIEVELRTGDVLYIPAYWWHQVDSLDVENVNLNFWWWPPLSKRLRHPNQAARGYVQLLLRLIKYGNIATAPARHENQPNTPAGPVPSARSTHVAR